MKLPTQCAGVTGDATRRASDDTARRPPSVKAALSVSFGQRAPHRASTRDSSPVRRTFPRDRNDVDDLQRSINGERDKNLIEREAKIMTVMVEIVGTEFIAEITSMTKMVGQGTGKEKVRKGASVWKGKYLMIGRFAGVEVVVH
eukprot:Gb_07116 [translate_table: standard]